MVAKVHALKPSTTNELNDALSTLALQGIAFIDVPSNSGEMAFVVDRVKLKQSELVYLHKLGALTLNGIRKYLLTRAA